MFDTICWVVCNKECLIHIWSVPSVAVFYLPMERAAGNLLVGVGINGTMKKHRGPSGSRTYPSIIQNGGKVGNGLQIQPRQWVDLGCQNERCLGNFRYCKKGFSLALWVKLSSDDWKCIITNSPKYGKSEGFQLLGKLNHTIEVAVATKRKSWKTSKATHCDLSDFCHVAFTWHISTGLQLYINGQLFQSDTVGSPFGITYPEDTNFVIGESEYFDMDGVVDEIKIWEQAMNESTIQQVYNTGLGLTN